MDRHERGVGIVGHPHVTSASGLVDLEEIAGRGGIGITSSRFITAFPRFPGGSGLGLMASISSLLNQIPSPGISQFLQIILVGRDKVRIGSNSPFINGKPSSKTEMPKVATSMEELREFLGQKGISSISGARC